MGDNENLKLYYNIREVAEMVDLPEHTLRFWEKEIPSLNPKKTSGGTRQYTKQDIELILFGIFLEELNLVTVTGTDLEARDASFLFLNNDCPSHSVTEVVAGFSLNGDICLILLVLIDLLCSRNSVQAGYPNQFFLQSIFAQYIAI